jgi:3D (Asp-Asp-Asp) domain-containing protein
MRILALTLALLLAPAVADAPMKQYIPPPKAITQQRAKQEPLTGRRVMFEVTAYTACDKGMRGDGITASGARAVPWRTVAASRGYAYGTRIWLKELNRVVVVHDRGGAIRGNRIDLYVEDRQTALKWGRRKLEGVVLNVPIKTNNSSLRTQRGK